MKLTGYTYGRNILTHFEKKALAMTENRSSESEEIDFGKFREITSGETYFWRVFVI